MNSKILAHAAQKITRFDEIGLHYNLVANQIYQKRFDGDTDPFDISFLPYIIAGLISFDLGRMMGTKRYDIKCKESFASRLKCKLQQIEPQIKPLLDFSLTQIDLELHKGDIAQAHNILSARGNHALHDKGKSFYVGATKILHFLNPNLFIIVDSNATRAFQEAYAVRPGYSEGRYIERMEHARKDILEYGLESFQALEPGVPITRIYDKLTFITGSRKEARLQ